jgi:hypothetical protein
VQKSAYQLCKPSISESSRHASSLFLQREKYVIRREFHGFLQLDTASGPPGTNMAIKAELPAKPGVHLTHIRINGN